MTYNDAQLALLAIGTLGVFATLFVYYRQLITMQAQLAAAQRASTGQNMLSLTAFLQAQDVRDARTLVIENLDPSKYDDWLSHEKAAASKVCSSYTAAGLILATGVLPLEPVLKTWGHSIQTCHERLDPHIKRIRAKAGPGYWWAFDWLYEEVLKMKPKGNDEGRTA